jgi:hypothetical protein
MTDKPPDEEVEAGRGELVMLRYSRVWPKAMVEWTRRHPSSGSQSFPIRSGTVQSTERPPDWAALRAQALEAAGVRADAPTVEDSRPRRSFFGRLLTRS